MAEAVDIILGGVADVARLCTALEIGGGNARLIAALRGRLTARPIKETPDPAIWAAAAERVIGGRQ
jgi:hypothetical protein